MKKFDNLFPFLMLAIGFFGFLFADSSHYTDIILATSGALLLVIAVVRYIMSPESRFIFRIMAYLILIASLACASLYFLVVFTKYA